MTSGLDAAQFSHFFQEALYLVVEVGALADIKSEGSVWLANVRRVGSLRDAARLFHIPVGSRTKHTAVWYIMILKTLQFYVYKHVCSCKRMQSMINEISSLKTDWIQTSSIARITATILETAYILMTNRKNEKQN